MPARIAYHKRLLEDARRVDLYRQAIRRLVRPGMRVLDLGCGTGVLGLMALQAGAERLYGIDQKIGRAHV